MRSSGILRGDTKLFVCYTLHEHTLSDTYYLDRGSHTRSLESIIGI